MTLTKQELFASPTIRTCVCMPRAFREALMAQAQAEDRTASSLIRKALWEYFQKHKLDDDAQTC